MNLTVALKRNFHKSVYSITHSFIHLYWNVKGDYALGGGLAEQSQHTDFGSNKSESKSTKVINQLFHYFDFVLCGKLQFQPFR